MIPSPQEAPGRPTHPHQRHTMFLHAHSAPMAVAESGLGGPRGGRNDGRWQKGGMGPRGGFAGNLPALQEVSPEPGSHRGKVTFHTAVWSQTHLGPQGQPGPRKGQFCREGAGESWEE